METEYQRPDVFNYWDHIVFFQDYTQFLKRSDAKYSIEYIARKSGVFKRSNLSLILNGKRNLQENSVIPLAQAIGLKKKEQNYILSLTKYNQTKDLKLKEEMYQELLGKKPMKVNLDNEKQVLLTKWYYLPLIDMIKIPGFKNDPKLISKRFRKLISVKEIREALILFQEIGIVKIIDGKWEIQERVLNSTQDIPSQVIQGYHLQSLELAKKAFTTTAIDEREFVGVTIPLNKDEIPLIKEEIRKLCKKIVSNRPHENLYQEVGKLNIQFQVLTNNGDTYE